MTDSSNQSLDPQPLLPPAARKALVAMLRAVARNPKVPPTDRALAAARVKALLAQPRKRA